ncbi:MAG: carbohydrate ABC transporter substrate-binding protein, partial [Chloroflexi bacterium]|nr:carbohydrate ABC transporter substrate-binding protein [Chloroflexota bacterium]
MLAILTARVAGGNPPDIAALAAPGSVESFAKSGDLVALDPFLDMSKIRDEYSQAWIDLCTVDGKLYCVAFKASNKSTVWYNPKTFAEHGWVVPTTWDELMALSDDMKAAGLSPWSVGVESGGASGWPGTDWIGQIVLSESGPGVYDQGLSGEVLWTDPAIKAAWAKFGDGGLTDGDVPGGSDDALAPHLGALAALASLPRERGPGLVPGLLRELPVADAEAPIPRRGDGASGRDGRILGRVLRLVTERVGHEPRAALALRVDLDGLDDALDQLGEELVGLVGVLRPGLAHLLRDPGQGTGAPP